MDLTYSLHVMGHAQLLHLWVVSRTHFTQTQTWDREAATGLVLGIAVEKHHRSPRALTGLNCLSLAGGPLKVIGTLFKSSNYLSGRTAQKLPSSPLADTVRACRDRRKASSAGVAMLMPTMSRTFRYLIIIVVPYVSGSRSLRQR